MRELRADADAPRPDDARLNADLNRLMAIRTKQRAMEDDRIRDVRKVLTPAQQAKLVLLLPRLERDFAALDPRGRRPRRRQTGAGRRFLALVVDGPRNCRGLGRSRAPLG